MVLLHETIRSRGITINNLDSVITWSDKKLFDLLEVLRAETPRFEPVREGPFTFVANDSLSGCNVPFSAGKKRLAKAAQLARFAALYADTLLIRNPFERYPRAEVLINQHGEQQKIGRDLEPQDFADQGFRQHLIDDIRLVLFFQPIMEAGLAGFTESTGHHWCPNCVRAAEDAGQLSTMLQAGQLSTMLPQPDEIAWLRRIAKLVRHLEQMFLKRGRTCVHQHGDHAHAAMFVPEGLLEYEQMQWNVELSPYLAKKAKEPIELSLKDARNLGVFADEVDRIIDDISKQNAAANRYNCQYITDRSIDLELMNIVSNKSAKAFNSASANALSHTLAFVEQVPLERILKLRKDEGEAFLVYRDAVRKVLTNAQGKTDKELREAFNDEIRPELNKIDLTMKHARKNLAISTLTDLTIAIASISIAAFSGLLPPDIGVPKGLIDVGAALGGWQGAKGLASKLASLRSTPKEVSENKYVFLWKVRNQSKKSR
jgi:hypothetical protein